MGKTNSGDDSVGYGKPPVGSRFVKGKSGNPKGRPRGSGAKSSFERVLQKKVTVTLDGQRRQVVLTEAVMMQLVQRALTGDVQAIRETVRIAELMDRARPDSPANAPAPISTIEFVVVEPGNPHPVLVPLDICTEINGQVVLRQWVVDAALARLPPGSLSASNMTLVHNSTEGTHLVRPPSSGRAGSQE